MIVTEAWWPLLAGFWTALARTSGLFLFAPIVSTPVVPLRVRAWLAIALALLASVPPGGGLPPAPPAELGDGLGALLVALREFGLGAAVGWLGRLPLLGIRTGGLLIGQQLGLGLARSYNPAFEGEDDALGQALQYLVLVGLLGIGGLERLVSVTLRLDADRLAAAAASGHGAADIPLVVLDLAVTLLGAAFELALRVSAPLLCIIYLETLMLGFVSKTAPAFNIMSLGFAIRAIIGMIVMIAVIGPVGEAGVDLVDAGLDLIAVGLLG